MNPPLVACRACGSPVSVDAAACPRCGQPIAGKPSPVAKIVAGVFAVGVGLYSLSMMGVLPRLAASPSATVECRGAGASLAAGMSCTIEHRSGASRMSVCWDVIIACANGARGSAHHCGEVDPGGKVSVAVPFAGFGGALDGCDRVSTMSVGGVSAR
jgi:hypothetical protein